MANPLSPETLQDLIKQLLPDDVGSLRNAATAIALLAHAIHTSLGFRLVKPAVTRSEDSDSNNNDAKARNKLPKDWLERNAEDESFALSYRHEQSSLLFEVRITRLGTRLVVNAVAVEDNKTATLDIQSSDYLSTSAFPSSLTDSFSLSAIFNSQSRLADFISLYKSQIIQKLIPGLVKPGYTEDNNNNNNAGGSARPPAAGPSQPRPYIPDYPDQPDRGLGQRPQPLQPGQNPLEIGRSDLDPLGGAMGRLPGAGGDGMFVGPNHPLFNRERDQNDPLRIPGTGGGGAGARGPWGGDGFLPPLGAPPGARFDPVGPFAPGGGMNMPRRNWGDEMPPPGFDNEGGHGFNPLNPGGRGSGGGFGGGPGGFGPGGFGPPRGGGGGAGGGFGNMFM